MEEFWIEEQALINVQNRKPGTNVVSENGLKYLQSTFPDVKFHQVKDSKFVGELYQVEKKHPQVFAIQT
jgi:hypothetical protein